jgi:hypothetical protein
MVNAFVKYYKADFKGIFFTKEKTHLPFYNFNHIHWEQLHFENIEPIDYYDSWEHRTSNSWYRKVLKPNKNFLFSRQIIWKWPSIKPAKDFPWIKSINWQFPSFQKRPHIIIPLNDQYQLQETLREVVLKKIELIDDGKEWFGGFREAKGIVYFQIHLDPPKAKKVTENKTEQNKEPKTQIVTSEPTLTNDVTNIWSINQDLKDLDSISPTQKPYQMTNKGNRRWRWFMLLWLLFCLWKAPALLIPSLLIFGGIAFFRYFRKACLGLLLSLFVFGIIGYFLFNRINLKNQRQETVKTEDGRIKIHPPKPNKDDKEILSEKEITWWDFIQNKYNLAYSTSATGYFESERDHEDKYNTIQSSNSLNFFRQLYAFMQQNDSRKLDPIISKFQTKAREKGLNAVQTAEMVCTFVQEIPYFLVHDLDCKQAVQQAGSGFMVQYHMENKPCLPNILGGVQTPYEFLHNLKGDCDTRSLLAYSILKKMGIPASIWISETYGHSVLGVGLPVAGGFYKNVNGIKHYAVELTAKGFRLGMISPEQQIESNWDIALFNNQ